MDDAFALNPEARVVLQNQRNYLRFVENWARESGRSFYTSPFIYGVTSDDFTAAVYFDDGCTGAEWDMEFYARDGRHLLRVPVTAIPEDDGYEYLEIPEFCGRSKGKGFLSKLFGKRRSHD
ncbi:hypothetical protein FHR99_003165 [Litorivivens lipolytica]|uniref:Uncharacterized protein n=1 Tax=Litorivivens lipolytica TaxID=1524264 RepID=A0A7W4W7G6_9GAMM|nr:hypothetical protein [Litorivivens lipolytica]MBB3048891.1 hypothetical protein [Litorivivens lipolytica]